MEAFENLLQQIPYVDSPFMIKVLKSIIFLALLWLIKIIIRQFVLKRISDVKVHYQWRKILNTIFVILGFIIIGRIWYEGVQSLVTYLGLLSAGIAVALKDPISNLAGWLFIVSRKPFDVGDRIQLGEYAGDVIDLSAFQISILEIGNWVQADQSTGRIIHIPNGKIFTQELANYDKGFKYIWNEIRVLITFESDWQKAKKILLEIVNNKGENISTAMERQIKRAARKFMIYYKNLTPIVYTDVKDSGVQLTIRHLCETRRRRGYNEAIWEDILTEFAKHDDIDLAYPTTRFYKLGEEK
ncbi:MAG: mechanosensitive ion channel family protein [Candidatus Cloacimonetes bacterium]|nr:mechanosensitive ion channel family protein [Candidatus Cloacimonadota bacterium]MCF7814481.1 mechanosensitive ion channel family protein [Candidatus Cloacimonadota bacterium]MCF7867873.1 mechanosensitive ion channel family protein [Candidatus Cloacimonadota bacterium]MCF7883692.1 mechanosensitive ion channel family protein [Candidatus Cloacimonadota bacterium]